MVLLAPLIAQAQFDHDAYLPRKLADAASEMKIDPRAQLYLDAAPAKISTDAVFTGEHRRTAPNVTRLINAWVFSLQLPPEYSTMFAFEVEMQQDHKKYWMPIQKQRLQGFVNDVQRGRPITLRAMLIGAESRVPVFIINGFVTH